MNYAVVSDADRNAVSMEFLGSKKVPEQNMCNAANLGRMAQDMVKGDTVWTVDVNRFGSVITFWNFYQACKRKGVTFKSLANPYLNYQPDKGWKGSYEKIIGYLIRVEQKMYNDICRACRGLNQIDVQNYAGCVTINILGQIFCTDGLMKRTSG